MSINIKDNIMGPDLKRTYEISLWTLQDSFIAVLGDSSSQYRGYIENPTMALSNDGTQELDFALPMYIDDGITRKKSNIWSQMTNAVTIAGMRKIKVIFNKGTDDQAIYEFIITKVTDTHQENQPKCEIHCEGLAFHELGKTGYKIALSQEGYEADYQSVWDSLTDQTIEEQIATVPAPNIDYWSQKIGLTLLPDDPADINSNIWYYQVKMDWSGFAYGYARDPKVVYEEAYVAEYDSDLEPLEYAEYQEKYHYVEASESNIYNLTQEIAKTFGVYCKYEYLHDDNFHIIGRIVTYYNNFIDEKNRLEFTYPYTSKSIVRENDCTDLVTKMYVNTIESNQSSTGLISIMDNPVNSTGEDYLLNFDYLYSIGTITDEQYAYIKEFSKAIKKINKNLLKWQEYQIRRDTVEVTYSAQLQVLENAMVEDQEQIDTYDAYLTNLTGGDGVIDRLGENGMELFVVKGTITFTDDGVINNNLLKVYSDYQHLDTQIVYTAPKSKYVTSISGIPDGYTSVYVQYQYEPKLYYEEVKKTYESRRHIDETAYKNLKNKIDTLNTQVANAETKIQTLMQQKNELLKKFERIMGPALREGNWTPEDYSHVASSSYHFISPITMSNTDSNWTDIKKLISEDTTGPGSQLIWDKNLNYNEIDVTYTAMDGTKEPYYILKLTSNHLAQIANFYSNDEYNGLPFGLVWWDSQYESHANRSSPLVKMITLGAQCECVFLGSKDNHNVTMVPALILTNLDETELANINNNSTLYLCGITTSWENNNFVMSTTSQYTINKNTIIKGNNYTVHQLRFHIPDYTLLTSDDNLYVYYGSTKLTEFNDYSIEQTVHTQDINENDDGTTTSADDKGYDITIKPLSLIKRWNSNNHLRIDYKCSQLSTAIYLDAIKILKENAYPKVTYSIDPNLIYEEFFMTDYNALNKIAFINDYELEFDQVQGYITNVNLNLDKPWEDTIEVKNYKNKFEDIFSTIVAQTSSMEKNEAMINGISNAVNMDGTISAANLVSTLQAVTLRYTLSTGTITLNKTDGIEAVSDAGAIALKPLSLCVATQSNTSNEWIWTKAITAAGINASAITYGTLSLDKVKLVGKTLSVENGELISTGIKTETIDNENVQTNYNLSINNGKLISDTLNIDDGKLISDTLSIDNGVLSVNSGNNLYIGDQTITNYINSNANTVITTWWGTINTLSINNATIKNYLKVGDTDSPIFFYQKENNNETASLAGWSLDNSTGLTYSNNNTLISKIAPTEFILNNYLTVNSSGVRAKTLSIEPDDDGHIITFINNGQEESNYLLKIDSEGLYYSLDDGTTWNTVAIVTNEPDPEPEQEQEPPENNP